MSARVRAFFVCVVAVNVAPAVSSIRFSEEAFLRPKANNAIVSLITDVAGAHVKDGGKAGAEEEAQYEELNKVAEEEAKAEAAEDAALAKAEAEHKHKVAEEAKHKVAEEAKHKHKVAGAEDAALAEAEAEAEAKLLVAARKEPVQVAIIADGPAIKIQSNALATNHEAVAMGSFAWMHETKQVESAFDVAFQQWGSAVRGAKFSATSTGDLVADPAITVPKIILDNKNESCASCQCAFVNSISMPAACDIEGNSRLMAVKWIPKTATVLEVGARYGSVSCTISRVLGNSGKQVSVDADERVWGALEYNRQNLGCNFHTAKGLLGTHDGKIMQNRYGTVASTNDTLGGAAKGVTVPHFTVEDLEIRYNLMFDTANFDCEGCFAPVSETFPEMFNNLKLLIVEVHDDKEAAAVAKLEANGWETIDQHSRQHVLKRTAAE